MAEDREASGAQVLAADLGWRTGGLLHEEDANVLPGEKGCRRAAGRTSAADDRIPVHSQAIPRRCAP